MSDLPSFANKADFYGVLLPGYLVLLAYLFLFHPSALSLPSAQSFSLLSVVIFVIAGPTIGLALQQSQRIFQSLLSQYWPKKKAKASPPPSGGPPLRGAPPIPPPPMAPPASTPPKVPAGFSEMSYRYAYATIRIKGKANETAVLDLAEAYVDFNASTAPALLGLFLLDGYEFGWRLSADLALIGALSAILWVSFFFARQDYWYTFFTLCDANKIALEEPSSTPAAPTP